MKDWGEGGGSSYHAMGGDRADSTVQIVKSNLTVSHVVLFDSL